MKAITVVFSILVVAILGFAITGHAATATITYTYDDLNRLTAVSYQGGIVQTFTPDEAGNITSSTVTASPVDSKGVSATTWAFFGTTDTSPGGIPDAWDYTYALNPYDPNVAYEDPDRDGYTNLAEYLAGTNPDNPGSEPAPVPALSTPASLLLVAGLGIILWRAGKERQNPSNISGHRME